MATLISNGERPVAPAPKRHLLPTMPPPISLSIEDEPAEPRPEPPLREAPAILLSALGEVCRLWWRKFFSRRDGR